MISLSWMSAIEISTSVELVTLAAAESTTAVAYGITYGMHVACFKAAFYKGSCWINISFAI